MNIMVDILDILNCYCIGQSAESTCDIGGLYILVYQSCMMYVSTFIHCEPMLGPHCVTIHNTQANTSVRIILSFYTGVLIIRTSLGYWVDNKYGHDNQYCFDTIVAPLLTLLPFYKHINPVRVSLLNTYTKHVIYQPSYKYHPSMVLTPQHSEPLTATTSRTLMLS